MSRQIPYLRRDAGDVVTADDWNRLQEMIREEIRQHRHEGNTEDTTDLGLQGTRLGNESLLAGAVAEAAFAGGAVTEAVLQPACIADQAVAADAAVPEALITFARGHSHDGATSTRLAPHSVGAAHIHDGVVTEAKITQSLREELADLTDLLAIPQLLAVFPTSPIGGDLAYLYVHGYEKGDEVQVRLFQATDGKYLELEQPVLAGSECQDGVVVAKMPPDPTGLLQVELRGVPLNPILVSERLAVISTSPRNSVVDALLDLPILVTFSTPIKVRKAAEGGGEADPAGGEADAPVMELHAERGELISGHVAVLDGNRALGFELAKGTTLSWDTTYVLSVYGADQANKPVVQSDAGQLLAETLRISFTTREAPPEQPIKVSVIRREGVDEPEDMISLANHRAVPVEVTMDPSSLASDWVAVRFEDGRKVVERVVPAVGGGQAVRVTLDAGELDDGYVKLYAQARNATNASQWTGVVVDRKPDDWMPKDRILKDTRVPYLRIHPVRSPTRFRTQTLEVEVEPRSTVIIDGGAQRVTKIDVGVDGAEPSGRLSIEVPLKPDCENVLSARAIDVARNRSDTITTDSAGRPLVIVEDETIPSLTLDSPRTPTRERTVIFTGKVDEPATITVSGGGRIASRPSEPDNTFQVPFDLEPNAANDVSVVATDASGNTTPPTRLRIMHDDTPPFIQLEDRGYSELRDPQSPNPLIVVRGQPRWISIGGYSEPGATLTLSGHGYVVTGYADANGAFTLGVPFRLEPSNRWNRQEWVRWDFVLDAVDPSGNVTNQRKNVAIYLSYEIPDDWRQCGFSGWWWFWGEWSYWQHFRTHYGWGYHVNLDAWFDGGPWWWIWW